ncbi:MAG TPA: type II restriction endonuclease, partial [Chthoniobacterales bacterium]|nr:type II restriction endonuclease [Chthoniobacterales bacterium]
RWRQVLSEGKRLDEKHLVTLEPAISGNQLAEMRAASLQLIVPSALQATYPVHERSTLMDLGGFISEVLARQKNSGVVPASSQKPIKAKKRKA